MSNAALKRDTAIDLCKAFLITLVVYGHVLQYYVPCGCDSLVFRFIYSFHMAAFMLVSGFIGFHAKMTWQGCRKKMLRLMVPFFAWWLLNATIRAVIKGDASTMLTSFVTLVKDPATGLWFFWVLGMLVLWLYGVQRVAQWLHMKENIFALLSWLVLFGVSRVFPNMTLLCFKAIVHYFVFFYLGYILCRVRNDFLDKKLFCWPAFFVLLAGHVLCFCLSNNGIPLNGVVALMASACGSLSVLVLFKCFKCRIDSVSHLGSMLGRTTFGIYAIHWYLLTLLCMIPYFAGGGT